VRAGQRLAVGGLGVAETDVERSLGPFGLP
jgi:hypothetical protein